MCDALDTMPYSMNVPPADAAVLDDLAALLDRPRDLYLDVYERQHGWTPTAGSLAEAELTSSLVLAGVVETELTSSLPAGDVSAFLVNHPRSVASLHVRLSADYLAGVGALFRTREIFFAPNALARIAFEHAVRAVPLLDSGVVARVRSARALLEDLVSAHFERLAWKHLAGEEDPSFKAADGVLVRRKDVAKRFFADVSFADDPFRWTIEGEVYMRPNKVGEYWSDLRADSVPAEGFYDVLSLYVHPQSFPSRHEASFDPETGESWLTADMDLLRKASMGALAAWIDAAGLLYGYQGWIVPELDELTEAGAALNP